MLNQRFFNRFECSMPALLADIEYQYQHASLCVTNRLAGLATHAIRVNRRIGFDTRHKAHIRLAEARDIRYH